MIVHYTEGHTMSIHVGFFRDSSDNSFVVTELLPWLVGCLLLTSHTLMTLENMTQE
jgi:hypothetical protein